MSEVDFFGEKFAVRDRLNSRALGKFAQLGAKGEMSEMVALAGLNDLVDTCLLPSDMDRFDAVCDRECPSYEQLAAFVASVVRAISERPTKRPSDSSDGSPSTEPVSTVVSSSPVIRRLQGRPDLQLMVMMAQEARATA